MKNIKIEALRHAKGLGIGILALAFGALSCSKQPINSPAEKLKQRLSALKGNGILFGHQDDLAYGIGWRGEEGRSDVKSVTDSYPAIFGWDLGKIELGSKNNLDGVPFESIKNYIIQSHKMGGINTISWHAYSPTDSTHSWYTDSTVVSKIIPGGENHETFTKHLDSVAEFIGSLRDENGELIPVLFRPWHEMLGSWFWWGQKECSAEEYKKLYRYTIEYLKDVKKLNNLVVVYSPDEGFSTKEQFLSRYPGDDIVDIIALDDYNDLDTEIGLENAIKKLQIVIEAANERGKFSALSETGNEFVAQPEWFTKRLGVVLSDPLIASELSYFLIWRNDENVHHFFSYPGHPSEPDTKKFFMNDNIWLLDDLVNFEKNIN